MYRFANAVILASSLCVVFFGCSQPTILSGTVSYDGQPVEEGYVNLLPADGKGPQFGGKITEGAYRVEMSPGNFKAQIIGVKAVEFAATTEEHQQMSEELSRKQRTPDVVFAADTIPEEAVGNYEEIEVTAGPQSHDFKLSSPK